MAGGGSSKENCYPKARNVPSLCLRGAGEGPRRNAVSESTALVEREQGRECRIVGRTGGSGPVSGAGGEGRMGETGKRPMGSNKNINAQFLSQTSGSNLPWGRSSQGGLGLPSGHPYPRQLVLKACPCLPSGALRLQDLAEPGSEGGRPP